MAQFERQQLVVFDIESSGLNVETDRIISLSACVTKADGSKVEFSELVNPGVLIPASASRVNNIYDETVSMADSFGEVGQRFLAWVFEHAGDTPVLCAYNGDKFDFPMLYYELRRHCTPENVPPFKKLLCVDPYTVAKAAISSGEVKNYRQTSVYEHLFGAPPSGQHSSVGDTAALDKIVDHDVMHELLQENCKTLKCLRTFVS